jgi:ribosomal protein S18 acetylase RimI-like enzyme
MSFQDKNKRQSWRRLPKAELANAENYLRAREKFCVAAGSRFLRLRENRGHVWHLSETHGEISALLLHSRRSLFPLFGANDKIERPPIPAPRFLSRFLGKVDIHAIQGLREDAELLENLMLKQGYISAERIDYNLMALDSAPRDDTRVAGNTRFAGKSPAGLVLRAPLPADEEALFSLQCAYEQEEVLSAKSVFDPAVVRLNLRQILSRERVLVAELDGQVVGKINTSAKSFTRDQIGGVYVRPDCRGLGIAAKMTAVFARELLSQGRGVTLFVKKRNVIACKVYRKIGFSTLADYRITYY